MGRQSREELDSRSPALVSMPQACRFSWRRACRHGSWSTTAAGHGPDARNDATACRDQGARSILSAASGRPGAEGCMRDVRSRRVDSRARAAVVPPLLLGGHHDPTGGQQDAYRARPRDQAPSRNFVVAPRNTSGRTPAPIPGARQLLRGTPQCQPWESFAWPPAAPADPQWRTSDRGPDRTPEFWLRL